MTQGVQGRRGRALTVLPWVVVGAVMVSLAGVAVVRLFVDEGAAPAEATSVQDVADLALTVTEELDVQGGVDLLCDQPIELYRMAVESTIIRWQTLSGVQAPAVTADVSDVDKGSSGSFVIAISSDEDGLEDEDRTFRVFVENHGGRSCVVGVGGPRAQRPTTRFAAAGYSGVTSPPPMPRSTPSPTPNTTGATP
ncbi:hypothetical protein [Nocardioides rubriscoriae]|uniref:hypothetical protein n=1 Tax=Nocardioides rubriscoriae TaxID=642762 RepID=UPI0011DF1C87|nr:hypothetical protein [Nocardioides rubriscoriae]